MSSVAFNNSNHYIIMKIIRELYVLDIISSDECLKQGFLPVPVGYY